jgi:tetratricopeptide (TPR) repeat protein
VRVPVQIVARVAVAALAAGLIAANGLSLLGERDLARSRAAAARGDARAALSDALGARRLVGWSSGPPLQLALIDEQAGDLPAARAWIARALARNSDDWRLWLVASRIELRQGDVRDSLYSFARARRLNPRSPLFSNTQHTALSKNQNLAHRSFPPPSLF